MALSSRERTEALLAAAQEEMESLAARGVRIEGNGFSSIVLVKGELTEAERAGAALLSGADGAALRAALLRLGYPPEDFCALGAVAGAFAGAAGAAGAREDAASDLLGMPTLDAGGHNDLPVTASDAGVLDQVIPRPAPGEPLPAELFREALEALDPEVVVLLDEAAADAMRGAYAEALAVIEQFEVAMLQPGLVAHVLGRRVLALGGFEAALGDAASKQRVWAYLKQLPPLGAPY